MSVKEQGDQDVPEVDEVDVEDLAKQGKPVPRAKRYRIRIDREKFIVEVSIITGRELLALVHKTPDKYRIHQKLRGGQMEEIQPDEKVDLRDRGVERFVTMEKAQTDGESDSDAAPRRAFRLPADDEGYLNQLGRRWETILDGEARWLFIHNQPVPVGFDRTSVTAAIRIEGGYPPAQLDMVYFSPALARSDGREIPALSTQQIEGTTYQRWSRHYTWRDDVDSVATHHKQVETWLVQELAR